jgi:hypothetical protein
MPAALAGGGAGTGVGRFPCACGRGGGGSTGMDTRPPNASFTCRRNGAGVSALVPAAAAAAAVVRAAAPALCASACHAEMDGAGTMRPPLAMRSKRASAPAAEQRCEGFGATIHRSKSLSGSGYAPVGSEGGSPRVRAQANTRADRGRDAFAVAAAAVVGPPANTRPAPCAPVSSPAAMPLKG